MRNLVMILLFLCGPSVFADFAYSCKSADGSSMGYTETSLFGDGFSQIFSYEDTQGHSFFLMEGDFRVINDGDQIRVAGALDNSQFASFLASFTVVYQAIDNIEARLQLRDQKGIMVASVLFQCRFR